MSRSTLRVRTASPADLDAVLELARSQPELTAHRPRGAGHRRNRADDLRARCRQLLDDPAHRVVLAEDDACAAPLGMAIFGVDAASTLVDLPAVYVSQLVVAPGHRRRGVGRALVAAATGYAEDRGIEHVMVAVASNGREASRFLARLGFGPLVVRRIATVAALRRTLGLHEPPAECRADVVRRRSLRASLGGLPRAVPRRLPLPRVRRPV